MVSDSGAKIDKPSQDGLRRLVRNLSGKKVVASPPKTAASIQEVPIEQEPVAVPASSSATTGEPLERVPSATSSMKKEREKISDRLKQLGKDIVNLRRGSDKSVPASPSITVGEVPLPRDAISSSNPGYGHAKLLSMVAELEEPAEAAAASPKLPADAPEPSTLAKRIQDLVDALPFPNPISKRPLPVPKNPKAPPRDAEGHPIPPPDATPIKDTRLIRLLSSPTIMNGSTVKGRASIWSVLEMLGAPPHGFPPPEDENVETGAGAGAGGENAEGENTSESEEDSIYTDNSSVMVYSPLIPTSQDHVELAELVPVHDGVVHLESDRAGIVGTSWTTIWPLSLWYTPSTSQPNFADVDAAKLRPSGEILLPSNVDAEGTAPKKPTARAWVPSTTKLSVQAMWWGYRLYLPPPVMDILSDKTLEATKRAAMITTALTWIFNNLPVDSLPLPLRPAALLLQRIAPYLGYIGTFISWSWSSIKSYDKGNGVTLTATWLLPVALIPATWKENDFPKSPSQNPIPLPPQTSPPPPPAPTSPQTTSASLSPTPATILSANSPSPASVLSVTVPVPPTPAELPPVPPSVVVAQDPVAVEVGSPLMEHLLHGPVLAPVPLPAEDAPTPQPQTPKKEKKNRAKAFFSRSSKQ